MLESSVAIEASQSPNLRMLHSRTRVKRKALKALPDNRQRHSISQATDAAARSRPPDIINTGK